MKNKNICFVQDNASVHTSSLTKDWLKKNNNFECMNWPALSPDLNPIENIWGYISEKVYLNKPSYSNKLALKNAIEKAWEEISLNYIENLINSMPKRIGMVIYNKGKTINY